MLESWLSTILIVQEILSWYLVGFIWLVQLSIYPQLDLLLRHAPEIWHQTHQRHCGLMGFFAGGPMIIQLVTCVACGYMLGDAVSWTLVGLVVITWVSTFFWSVPCHDKLGKYADPAISRQLLNSNWLRTIVWTGAAPLASWLRYSHIG